MDSDFTQHQSTEDERKARELSLHQTRPPTHVPGYELTQFLGAGAYGEVWIGVDRSTGRKVAVKFYRARNRVDWAQLAHEVEKLVFLSADRYVVQLLNVGWDADPPYYVMEYIENGSLEHLLKRDGPRDVAQAVALFREIVIGLNHAHARGVLHCDLKPANVLLDQDGRPRLADFGQSRLSHEQAPSLGTLFYMSMEQADLQAVPDAQWDVYALGAILYCILAGRPPHQTDDIAKRLRAAESLPERLTAYRNWLADRPPIDARREIGGIDRALANILERCLATNRARRFANVQEILDAIDSRNRARRRRPLLVLGIVGPLLLMIITVVFGWRGYYQALGDSQRAVTDKVIQNNALSAKYVAATVATEIQRYFAAVDRVAADPEVIQLVTQTSSSLQPMLASLADPKKTDDELEPLREQFRQTAQRQPLQQRLEQLLRSPHLPRVASWFICDAQGTHLAGAFDRPISPTIGKNFAYRTYCHGGQRDLTDHRARPLPAQHVERTQLSAPLRSTATNTLKIAVSTPLHDPAHDGRFIGVLALTVEVGNFLSFAATDTQLAVLIDSRSNDFQGAILYHPLFTRVFAESDRLPDRFTDYRVRLNQWSGSNQNYRDPLGDDPRGTKYNRTWIAAAANVDLPLQRSTDTEAALRTGLVVLIQEDRDAALRPVTALGRQLAREGVFALIGLLVVVLLLWFFVFQVVGQPRLWDMETSDTTLSGARNSMTPLAAETSTEKRWSEPPDS